jgi:acyl-CoA thioesterase-1
MKKYSSIKLITYFWFFCIFGIYTTNSIADSTSNKKTIPTILVLGDSISSGLGIPQSKIWVNLLSKRLQTPYYHYNLINASISGETTQGGLTRISGLIDKYQPEIVILELGGNDGLQGLPLALMKDNLDRTIKLILARDAKVLLLGMQLPPNYGKFFTKQFHAIYIDLAKKHDIALVPFLMEGFAKDPKLMQADGIHPRAEAQRAILNNVWPHLRPLLPKRILK